MKFLSWIRTKLRDKIIDLNRKYLNKVWGMNIESGSIISFKAILDKTNPNGINIGKYTYIARGACVLSHDYVNREKKSTYIGDCCFVGMNAIVMPGIRIGDGSIIAANTVVLNDVPKNSLVAGNPGKVVKSALSTSRWGQYEKKN